MNEPVRRLDRDLAQRVVDRVGEGIEHNLNLMDTHGIIIASRDVSRIGTLHSGARDAARTGETVLIHPGQEPPGARAGVNVPIESRGQVVGVVGVTGDPRQILSIGQVVRLATQLLLEQATEQDVAARREANDRDLVARLLAGSDPAAIGRALRMSAPTPGGPWSITALVPTGGEDLGAAQQDQMHAALAAWGRTLPSHWALVVGTLWIVAPGSAQASAALRAAAAQAGLRGIASDPSDDPEVLSGAARSLAATVPHRSLLPARAGEILPASRIPLVLAAASLPDERARYLSHHVMPLTETQRATLLQYVAAGFSAARCAAAMHAHRNTILQRLERVERLTGLDPHRPMHALTLALGTLAAARDAPADAPDQG